MGNFAKGLINLKSNDSECLRWCDIRHLNPQEKHPQRIKKTDKQQVENLDYSGIEFPISVKQYNRIEKQTNFNVNVFGCEEKQHFLTHLSKEQFKNEINLSLINDESVEFSWGKPSDEEM